MQNDGDIGAEVEALLARYVEWIDRAPEPAVRACVSDILALAAKQQEPLRMLALYRLAWATLARKLDPAPGSTS